MNNSSYAIAVFSVRTSTLQFNSVLVKNGVKSLIIETPKAVSASCGICVRFDISSIKRAKDLLERSEINNFVRFYVVENIWGSSRIRVV